MASDSFLERDKDKENSRQGLNAATSHLPALDLGLPGPGEPVKCK